MGVDARGEVWLLVVGVSDIRGNIGMITEEGLVERGNGGSGVAHTLHADRRKVDIEVATKAGDRFGMLRVEVGVFVGADANEASLVTSHDSAVPAE